MALQWKHSPLIKLPPPKPTTALEQLNANSAETNLRLGNLGELKKLLDALPIRLDVDLMVLRTVRVDMSDIFAGKAGKAKANLGGKKQQAVCIRSLEFTKMREVTIKKFLEAFLLQVASHRPQATAAGDSRRRQPQATAAHMLPILVLSGAWWPYSSTSAPPPLTAYLSPMWAGVATRLPGLQGHSWRGVRNPRWRCHRSEGDVLRSLLALDLED